MDADAALADAAQGAGDAALAKGAASVELSAAERLAQALANGENVSDLLDAAGGGDAFAAALEAALAAGVDSGAALAQADAAQAQQVADAAQQSVPLSAADQLAAALASGVGMDAVMAQVGGNEAFAAALQESLADGAAPDAALASGDQAAAAADAVAATQGVPVSPADQLAASLASGENVAEALAEAGGGEAFGEELATALAEGQSPGESVAQAQTAQDAAATVAQAQSVPADPAATALAQGSDAAKGVDLASAVADATGTTGEQPSQNQPEQSQSAQEGPAAGTAGETQAAATDSQAPRANETASVETAATPAQTPQTTSQPSSTTAQSVNQVAEGPGEGDAESAASDENSATGDGVTKVIEVASTGSDGTQATSGTGQADTAAATGSVPDGGGSDGPSDADIDALQDIATAAGPSPSTGSNGGFSGKSDFEAAKSSTNIGGSNSTLGGFSPPVTTPAGPTTGGGGRTTSTQNTRSDPPPPTDSFINSAPTANADTAAMTENQTITIPVLANDTDPDGHSLSISTASVPAGQGTVSISGSTLIFAPGSDFDFLDEGDVQSVSIAYSISDGFGGSSSSTVNVTVTGTNDAPVIVVDDSTVTGAVTEGVDNAGAGDPALTTNGELSFVDVDADDSHTVAVTPQAGALGSIAAVITTAAEGGTGTVSWVYTADERDFDHLADGETATEVFRVTITDSHGATAFQDVRVTVTGTNDSPVANTDIATTSENVAITVSVTANDTDIDNDTAELTVISAETERANEGVVTFDGGDITFTPGTEFDYLAVGESRIVKVNYTIQDPGGLTASSTLSITVTGTNDVPIVSAPITVAPVSEDDAAFGIDLLATASDVDISDVLRTESVSVTSSDGRIVSFTIDDAVGKLVLNPAQFGYLDDGEQVTLTVDYLVTDGNGGSVPNTASVVVTGANDAPTISGATKIYAQENFENGAAGWSDPTVSSVPGLTQFLGNFAQGGITEKTFSIPADGSNVIVRFDFHRFDSWDGEDFHVLLNGAVMLQGTFQHGEETANGGFVPLRDELEDFAFGVWDDSSYRVTLTLSAGQIAALPDDGNGGKIFTLGFTSTLNQNADDESWGVDNLLIRAGSGAFRAGDEDSTMAVDGLTVGDIDGDALTVTLDVPAGILMLTDGGGDAVIQNAGSGLVTVSGAAAAINAALKTLLYTPEANANGIFALTVTAHDGTVSTVKTYDLFVRPVMDATEIVRPAALDFTGTGTNGDDASFSYAIAEGFDIFPSEQGTVEFWVKTTDTSGSLLSYAVPGSANELWLTLSSGSLDVWLNNSSLVSVSGTGINDGEWHNVALSFGGGAGQTVLMVDGIAVATLDPTTPLTPGGTIELGNDQDSVGGSFQVSQALDGQIDGLRIWDSVRSEAQIQAAMSQNLNPAENPDLVADYRLDGTLVSAVEGAPAFVLQNADFQNEGSLNGLSGLEQQAISLSDIDILNVDGDLLTVTLNSAQGVVSATGGTGLAEVGIVPGGITITGFADDVRAAMDTATFTSNHNFSGTAQIAVSVAGGGDGPVVTTIPVAVTAVNTAPSISAVQNSTGALLMDGTDSLVTIPHSPALDFGGTTPMSIEMRVQTSDDVTTLQTLFDKSNLDFGDASAFRFHISGGHMSVWNSSANFDSAPFLQPNTW